MAEGETETAGDPPLGSRQKPQDGAQGEARPRAWRIGPGGWWLTFTLPRTGLAVVAALVVVPVAALVMKTLVESTTSMVYEIHWLETVPWLVILFTIVFNRLLNERAARFGQTADSR